MGKFPLQNVGGNTNKIGLTCLWSNFAALMFPAWTADKIRSRREIPQPNLRVEPFNNDLWFSLESPKTNASKY